jgi:hypothetical protein
VDPDSIWLDLCLNRDRTKDRSRAFLRRFVKDLVKRVPILRPEEYELKRILNLANTLLNVWSVGKMAVLRCQPSRASPAGRHRQDEQGDRQ